MGETLITKRHRLAKDPGTLEEMDEVDAAWARARCLFVGWLRQLPARLLARWNDAVERWNARGGA